MKKNGFFSSFKSYSSLTHDGTLEDYRKSRNVNTYVALVRDDQTSSFYRILGTDRFCVHAFEQMEKTTLDKIFLSFLHYNKRETGYIYAYQKDLLYKYLSFGYPMFNLCLSKKI